MNIKEKILMLGLIISMGLMLVLTANANDPRGNGVIVAGNFWASYRPPHIPGAWPGREPYVDDFQARGDNEQRNGNWLFWQSRYVSSGRFGNTVAAWPFGKNIAGPWGEPLGASVFDPSAEFASANARAFAQTPLEPKDLQYSYLKYGSKVPGAGDPARDYVRPGGKSEGGAFFKDGRKGVVYYEAGWPTNVGIDVRLRAISMTTTWGNLDDQQLVEVEFYNTGEADIDGDGVVDLSNHRIESLALQYHGEPWYMTMALSGGRSYNTGGYRPGFHDATPDENGAPWAISGYGFGAVNRDLENDPGLSSNQGNNTGWYHDIIYGWTYLGAKKIENGMVVGEKMLAFKNSAGEEVVHPVGEGNRRGWFMANTTTESWQGGAGTSARGHHLTATAQFFVAGSKNRSSTDVDFNPNPAMFVSGNEDDLSSFVVKDDPNTWEYPDGAFEMVPPVTSHQGISLPGPNPIPTFGGSLNRPFQADLLHAGFVSESAFNEHPTGGFGPFALDVGETIRVYFVRAMGHRMTALRAAIKGARAMYDGIQPDGSFLDPGAPGVPDIKVTGSTNVKPLIMFNTVADADGYKIYRSKAWPPYDPTEDGLIYEDVYWKTNTPGAENRPAPEPLNPMLTDFSRVRERPGEHWGPYVLLGIISNAELDNFQNPRTVDASQFPYALEDNQDAFTLPGQTFYYYVAAYKNSRPPAPYDQLEDASVTWIESGKVNVNGRNGLWQDTWPSTPQDPFYPDETDTQALQDLGAPYVLVSPPVTVADLELGRANIVVRPNPYKRLAFHDVGAEHKILFANLPTRARITILDLSGQIIDRIEYESPTDENGTFFWDMFSKNGIEVASGVYIWVVEHDRGVEKGILSILR